MYVYLMEMSCEEVFLCLPYLVKRVYTVKRAVCIVKRAVCTVKRLYKTRESRTCVNCLSYYCVYHISIFLCVYVYKSFIFIFVYYVPKCIFVHAYLCICVKFFYMYICVQYTHMYVCVCMCVDMLNVCSKTIHKYTYCVK